MQDLFLPLRRHFGQFDLSLLNNEQGIGRLFFQNQRLSLGIFPVNNHGTDPGEIGTRQRCKNRHLTGTGLCGILTGMFRHLGSLLFL
ncbi:hypothetical protein D3C75_1082900 [compost metagenome]